MLATLITLSVILCVVVAGLYFWDRAEPKPEAREDQFPVER